MVMRFDGNVALVTGGNSGLGLAAAKAFAAEGAEVVISGRDRHKLDAAVAEIGAQAMGIVADVSRVQDIAALMREVESRKRCIDVLFANAGIARFAPIESVTESDWDGMMGTNVKGLYFTVQQALPLMRRGGAIVLNASLASGKGGAERVGLFCKQGRNPLAGTQSWRRTRRPGHQGECGEPRSHRDADLRDVRRGHRRPGRDETAMGVGESDEALRHGRGSGARRPFPRVG